MSVFTADCPHCGTKSVSFTITKQVSVHKSRRNLWDTLAICGQCSRGILATFVSPDTSNPAALLNGNQRNYLSLPVISPSLPSSAAPEGTPENVARFYRQGMNNLPGAWDAAALMFRKVLETGLKAKFPEIKGDLNQRIKMAAENHDLTPALAEWAHQIRLDGNDAAHEEDAFSEEDAKRLQMFTELVLTYLFKLPDMLKRAQGIPEEEAEASGLENPEPCGGEPPSRDVGIP